MPFASMSNVTSICGTPRGAGGIPTSWNFPSVRFPGRNGRVALNQHGHHATLSFDTQGQRSNVEQQNILYFAAEHAALNRRANCHDFIGVNALVRLFAVEEALDDFYD